MAARVEKGESVDDRDVDTILDFLKAFGDDHHQEKEEAILFPALLKASHSEEFECLCRITFEHNQQRSLLEGMEDALRSRKGADFVYYAKRMAEIMRSHIQAEEQDLFLCADSILTQEEDECIAKEMAAYDSPQRAERLSALLRRLIILEIKYGTPASTLSEKTQSV
jgi:hemerythrin-like domain-containing protein